MTAITPPGDFGDGGGGEIRDTPLSQALSERYLAYALSTIVSRSLPDVRDGLKPVHRRLLYAMRQRTRDGRPKAVDFLLGTPEENLHYFKTRLARFGATYWVRLNAPFRGKWTVTQGVEGSIVTFLADTTCAFTRAVGMVLDHPGPMGVLGNPRCKRFVLVVDDGAVTHVEVSEAADDPAGDNEPEGPVTAKTRVEHILTLL